MTKILFKDGQLRVILSAQELKEREEEMAKGEECLWCNEEKVCRWELADLEDHDLNRHFCSWECVAGYAEDRAASLAASAKARQLRENRQSLESAEDQRLCSICRSVHGREIIHACE